METAIRYYKNCRVLPQAAEIILRYNETHETLKDSFDDFTQEQRIVLDVTEYPSVLNDELKIWREAAQTHPKFAVMLSKKQEYILPDLSELNIDYFFNVKIDTLDKLRYFMNLGVSDVYICNELGFVLAEIGVYCHKNNVKVRVYPNIAQSSYKSTVPTDDLYKFFIRPEDIDRYEPYVDVIEFYTDRICMDKQSVLFEIYKQKSWTGGIKDIILNFSLDINNAYFVPLFTESRLNCRKRCVYGKCHICDRVLEAEKLLTRIEDESGYRFEMKREE